MRLILTTNNDEYLIHSYSPILCTAEQMDAYYLMHYRTKGSKNGQRRYQDESGRLTEEGYRHYADMYGWNKRLARVGRLQDRASRDKESYNKAIETARSAKDRANRANERNERGNKWTRQANDAEEALARASENKTAADNQKIVADYRVEKRNGGFGAKRLERNAARASEAVNRARADLNDAQATYNEAQKTALIKNSTGLSGFMARHRQANADRANEAFEDAKENLIYTKGRSERAQSKVDAYLDRMERKAEKIDSKINQKFDESQLEQAKGLVTDLKKKGIIDKDAGQLTSIAKMENKKTSIANDSDLAIRDAITGLGTIIKEDLDDHSYLTSVKVGNNVEAYVKIKRDGKDVNVTSYAEEGLIKQGLAKKAIGKVEEALGKINQIDKSSDKSKEAQEDPTERRKRLSNQVSSELYDTLAARSKEADKRLKERGMKKDDPRYFNEHLKEMSKVWDENYDKDESEIGKEARREKDAAFYSAYYGWNRNNQKSMLDDMYELDAEERGGDGVSKQRRKMIGNGLLDCLKTVGDEVANRAKQGEKIERGEYKEFEEMGQWLTEQIYNKSGSWNAGSFDPKSKAYSAYEKVNKAYEKQWDQEDAIKKEIGYKSSNSADSKQRQAEYKRLQKALKSDKVWQSLNELTSKAEDDLCGAILKDLGFSDTPTNRSIIFMYAFID